MGDLTASASLRGQAIDLALAWTDPLDQPRSLRIVRRRRGYPTGPDDGLVVLDLADLFRDDGVPWARIDRTRFLIVNTLAEGGLLQAEIAEYHADASGAAPSRVIVRAYDETTRALQPLADASEIRVPSDRRELQSTVATLRSILPLDVSFHTSVITTVGTERVDVAIRTVEFMEASNPDTGDRGRSITLFDREPSTRTATGFDPGLQPGITCYYAAFESAGKALPAGRAWTASAVATGRYGFAEKLFQLLPAIHRFYDDPASGRQGSWQLRNFLQIFGPGLDQARSLGESLSTLHDIFEVRADHLAYLAHWIGWEPDRTLSTQRQRNDVLFAPEVFSTVGTAPNIRALVNRATGWDCTVKEFVNNVFLTNAVEPIRLWEIWEADGAKSPLPVTPKRVTTAVNDSIDARPTVAVEPTSLPRVTYWLFWHSRRLDRATTRRQIWMKQLDSADPTPRRVMLGAPDDGLDLTFSDESPAALADRDRVHLFWSSNRSGSFALWTRTLVAGKPGDATRLTNHPAGDYHPCAVKDANETLWLFWQSSRRGPTDIWAMSLTSQADAKWSTPRRITGGQPRDETPAAFVDANNDLCLIWSRDFGDRSRLYQSTYDGISSWSKPTDILSGSSPAEVSLLFRDEASAVVQLAGGKVRLFWSSNRDGVFRLWTSERTGATWSAPVPVTKGRSAEKDPAGFVDGSGTLRLLFRTQRGGEIFRSRTVDLQHREEVKRGDPADRWHYTYSFVETPTSFYARDKVGLYLPPSSEAEQVQHQAEVDRLRALVEPFRPLPVSFVWFAPLVLETLRGPSPGGAPGGPLLPMIPRVF